MKKSTSTTIFVMVIVAVALAILVGFYINMEKEPKTLGPVFLVASAAEVEHDQAYAVKTSTGSSESENTSTSTGSSSGNLATIPNPGETDGDTGKTVKSVEKISESSFTVNGKEAYSVTYKITFTDGTSCVRGISSSSITPEDFSVNAIESDSTSSPASLTGLGKLASILARSLDAIQKRMDLLFTSKIFW